MIPRRLIPSQPFDSWLDAQSDTVHEQLDRAVESFLEQPAGASLDDALASAGVAMPAESRDDLGQRLGKLRTFLDDTGIRRGGDRHRIRMTQGRGSPDSGSSSP